jgi:hypothetical protein
MFEGNISKLSRNPCHAPFHTPPNWGSRRRRNYLPIRALNGNKTPRKNVKLVCLSGWAAVDSLDEIYVFQRDKKAVERCPCSPMPWKKDRGRLYMEGP